ncbi:MAG: hypothetical protein M3Y27_04220 [Acidobacteriota bacterium]|nr:hypothetical protein [Acidobacteriota bacterium]
MPTWVSATPLMRRANPERLFVLAPDSPRSSSMTTTLLLGPAQLTGPVGQGVLASGGFAVMLDLAWGGLANVDVGGALGMRGFDFGRISH